MTLTLMSVSTYKHMYCVFFSCDDVDSVIVSVTINDERRDIGVYCGSKLPPVLMSNDNRMEVMFISRPGSSSSGGHSNRGFNASYSFVEGKVWILRAQFFIFYMSCLLCKKTYV